MTDVRETPERKRIQLSHRWCLQQLTHAPAPERNRMWTRGLLHRRTDIPCDRKMKCYGVILLPKVNVFNPKCGVEDTVCSVRINSSCSWRNIFTWRSFCTDLPFSPSEVLETFTVHMLIFQSLHIQGFSKTNVRHNIWLKGIKQWFIHRIKKGWHYKNISDGK